eukprot:CAMPEP_0176458390 /NCGR_PEP_ID=MMETSP0127-20121128/32576_1 /TAXON_ID=938130 /ORGANISM="Platyophrya macrostoma, Strain WH" /LENGTH=260 /DNA_ID=CAMNT_0017848973 /DNA_START=21 /DNA_END=803 /DNA_ORIENTATION=-
MSKANTGENFYRSSVLSKMSPQNNPLRNTTRLFPFCNKNTPSQALQFDKKITEKLNAPPKQNPSSKTTVELLEAVEKRERELEEKNRKRREHQLHMESAKIENELMKSKARGMFNPQINPPIEPTFKPSKRHIEVQPSRSSDESFRRQLKPTVQSTRELRCPITTGDEPKSPSRIREEYTPHFEGHLFNLKKHYLPATRGHDESPPKYSKIAKELYWKDTISQDPAPGRLHKTISKLHAQGENMKSILSHDYIYSSKSTR